MILLLFVSAFPLVQAQHFSYRVFEPFPPALARGCDSRLNVSGRVQAIAVNRANNDHVVIANQFGGLWRTTSGGNSWEWVNFHHVTPVDVAYGKDQQLFCTVAADSRTVNGGGIYRSPDNGDSWTKLDDAMPAATGTERLSAFGIAVAPGRPDTVYIGTEKGISITFDGGNTWRKTGMTNTPGDVFQVQNVLAVTADTVMAGTNRGLYISYNAGMSWRLVMSENFTWSINRLDNHPVYTNKVFMIGDAGNLYCYDTRTNTSFTIAHPSMGARWPFVRVSTSPGTTDYTLWFSNGVCMNKAVAANEAALQRLTEGSESWTVICGNNLHDDMGDIVFNNNKTAPLFAGSDGGIFKPADNTGTVWQSAAIAGSGMNSLQITGLSGTQIATGLPRFPYSYDLYFTTQDNNNHSSNNNGRTWTFCDCTEGHSIKSFQRATPSNARVAYANISCVGGNKIANRNFASTAPIRTTNDSPDPIQSWYVATPITAGRYFGSALLQSGNWGFFSSTAANADNWRLTATCSNINPMAYLAQPTRYRGSTAVYFPASNIFDGGYCNPNNRVGLLRFNDIFATGVTTLTDADRIMLPDNGSLAQVATEFDWHSVYGVHPEDGEFIIAPDVCNQRIMVTRNGGTTWEPDNALLNLVTRNGEFILYNHQYRMQLTHIGFDPYNNNHILVGTRDVGIIESFDKGLTWQHVNYTEPIKYITGFFFEHDGTIVVSTYGSGLWRSSMQQVPFPELPLLCRMPCLKFQDPRRKFIRDIQYPDDFIKKQGLLVYGGHILNTNQLLSGSKKILVSKGATVKFYNMTEKESSLYTVTEAMKPQKANDANIVGFTWEDAKPHTMISYEGVISAETEFATKDKNMVLANYDFRQEDKKDKKTKFKQQKRVPFFIIRGKTEDVVNPQVSGDELEVHLFNIKDEEKAIAEIAVDDVAVTERTFGGGKQVAKGLVIKIKLPEGSKQQGVHTVKIKLVDGTELQKHFIYRFRNSADK